MKRINRYTIVFVFLLPITVFLSSSPVPARETLLERIRKKRLEKKEEPSTPRPGDQNFSIQHDGLKREYGVHVPPSYKEGNGKTPVVIYLHGGGGSIKSAYEDGIDKVADKFGFILAIPAATRVKVGRRTSSRWNGGKWEGGECCGSADDVGFISKMIEDLKKRFTIDEKRIYATGISNGGLMANRLACELSDKIAAVAVVAPAALPQNCRPSRPISVMIIHGTADPINPFDGSKPGVFGRAQYKRMSPKEVVNSWLKINGCSGDFSAVSNAGHTPVYKKGNATVISFKPCKDGVEVQFGKVEGMGHTWPSGSQYLSPRIVGPVSRDISTDQIWEFFKRHSLK